MELKNKIMELCREHDNKYAKPLMRKKVRLLKITLVDEETDVDKILNFVPIGLETVEKYIKEYELFSSILTREEFLVFKQRIQGLMNRDIKKETEIKENESNEKEDIKFLRYLIDDILNTRHSLDYLVAKNYIQNNRFSAILRDDNYLDDNFGVGTKEKIQKKLQENKLIRIRCPRNEYVIEDRYQIKIAKDEIIHLDSINFKKLELATSYIFSNADIEFVSKKHAVSPISLVTWLSSPGLDEIIKPEYYLKIKKNIYVEKLLYEQNIIAKKVFLVEVIEFLENNNFDKEIAMHYFDIPENLFDRVLNEILKLAITNDQTKNEIKNITTSNESSIKRK